MPSTRANNRVRQNNNNDIGDIINVDTGNTAPDIAALQAEIQKLREQAAAATTVAAANTTGSPGPFTPAYTLSAKSREPKPDLLLKGVTADSFPKLEGVGNYAKWEDHFTRLARNCNYAQFFDGSIAHLNQGSSQEWFQFHSLKARDSLVASCEELIQETIRDEVDPAAAWQALKRHNKVEGCNHIFDAIRTLMNKDNGSPIALQQKFITVQAKLKAIDTRYILPGWLVNSLFIRSVDAKYDANTAALESNTAIVDPDSPMPFLTLTKSFLAREQRNANNESPAPTLAVRDRPGPSMSGPLCTRCQRPGHKDEPGPRGCWYYPGNESFRRAHLERLKRKRSGTDTGPDTKSRRVELGDFSQDHVSTGVTTTHQLAPPEISFDE
ncbi:hypothetical protein K402DRAFT_182984 [Aulographum hederae CBS 113979]|uniref:Uncharacterized protein n=1 Tax=Aulographum hederae CBS 113979 TaxID=1176131 RepID=A0A6G1GQV4_9PEZI|nr:hypothetical protein K402DRAFT_182984 [Aulographum hederae CBS 113979]